MEYFTFYKRLKLDRGCTLGKLRLAICWCFWAVQFFRKKTRFLESLATKETGFFIKLKAEVQYFRKKPGFCTPCVSLMLVKTMNIFALKLLAKEHYIVSP